MLQKYAIATSAVEIVSLAQLSNVCRRVDQAYSRSSLSLPGSSNLSRPSTRPTYNRTREVHEVEQIPAELESFSRLSVHGQNIEPSGCGAVAIESEVCEVGQRNARDVRPNNVREVRERREQEPRRSCFNCRKDGHIFSECGIPRTENFCYRCGSRDFVAFKCNECAKNAKADSQTQRAGANPNQQ